METLVAWAPAKSQGSRQDLGFEIAARFRRELGLAVEGEPEGTGGSAPTPAGKIRNPRTRGKQSLKK